MDRRDVLPREVGDEVPSDGTALVVHAPGMELADRRFDDVSVVEDLPTEPDGETLVRGFYDAWGRADTDRQAAFTDVLRERDGVHVAVTPRQLDWLHAEGSLTTTVLERIDRVVRVRFDPEDDVEAAVNVALEQDGTLDRDEVRSVFGDRNGRFVYDGFGHEQYDSGTVGALVRTYDETLVPRAVEFVSVENRAGRRITERLRGAVESALFTESYDELREGLLRGSEAGMVSGEPSVMLGSAGLAAYLRFGAAGSTEEYEQFVDTVPPHERAEIERAFQFPPLTFDRLEEFAADTLPQLLEAEVVTRDELESAVGRVENQLLSLDREVRRQSWRVKRRLDRVADPLAALGESLERNEENVLRTPVTVDEIPYASRSGVDDDRPDDRREATAAALEDSDFVVLAGASGTGKTTVAYHACEQLAQSGYEVCAVDFRTNDAEYVEERLREAGERTVVYVQYGYGEYSIRDEDAFDELLGFLTSGVCSKVILERRSESRREFRERMDRTVQSRPEYTELWENAETVRFPRFGSGEEEAEELAKALFQTAIWALDTAGYDPDSETELRAAVGRVFELSEGNPEGMKIAARFVAEGDPELSDVETVDELIWNEVRGTLRFDPDTTTGKVLRRVAAFGEVTTAELEQMVDDPLTAVEELHGYLGGSVRDAVEGRGTFDPEKETWQLSPDVYADVLFRKFALDPEESERTLFRSLLDDAAAAGDDLFPRLATQVGTAFESALGSDDEALQESVVENGTRLANRVESDTDDDEAYYRSLRTLLFDRVPVPVGALNPERIVSGSEVDVEEFELDSRVIGPNIYARVVSNAVEGEVDIDGIEQVATQAAELSGDDRELFLENVYAMAIKNLADEYAPTDDTIPDWLNRIYRLSRDAADETQTDTTQFLFGIHRAVLRQLADYHSVGSLRPWLDRFEAVLHRNDTLGTEIRQRYGTLVSVFYERSLPPGRADEWGEYLLRLYYRVIDRSAPSMLFRRVSRRAPDGSYLAHVQYAHALRRFDGGELTDEEFAELTARFLDAMSTVSDETAEAEIELVAHELDHIDADLDTVAPEVRRRLRTEHQNGELAGKWRAQFAGGWPEPTIPTKLHAVE